MSKWRVNQHLISNKENPEKNLPLNLKLKLFYKIFLLYYFTSHSPSPLKWLSFLFFFFLAVKLYCVYFVVLAWQKLVSSLQPVACDIWWKRFRKRKGQFSFFPSIMFGSVTYWFSREKRRSLSHAHHVSSLPFSISSSQNSHHFFRWVPLFILLCHVNIKILTGYLDTFDVMILQPKNLMKTRIYHATQISVTR